MDKKTPPPLPPKNNLPTSQNSTPSKLPPTRPQPQQTASANTEETNIEDIEFDVVESKKSNPWLWIIPIILILLLAGGGIYAWYYMEEKSEKERKERQEEREAEEERQQEIADSIAAAEREQAYQDSLRVNFTSPALNTFNLKGHVKSLHMSFNGNYDGYLTQMLMIFNDKNINFDYDGNFVNLAADLNNGSTPSVRTNSDGHISSIDYVYDYNCDYVGGCTDAYSFSWTGDRISRIDNRMMGDSNFQDTYQSYDDNGVTCIKQTYSYTSSYDYSSSTKRNITFTITYSDLDSYGNWTKAQISGTGSETNTYNEYDTYYDESTPRTRTDNINFSYTLNRYINYWE